MNWRGVAAAFIGLWIILAPVTSARAQSSPAATSLPPGFSATCGDSTDLTYTKTVNAAASRVAEQMVGYGALMLRAFLIVSLAWYGAVMMFSVGTALAEPQQLVMKVIAWGFIYTVFNFYGLIYHDVYSIFQHLGEAASNSAGSGGSAICMMDNVNNRLTLALSKLPGSDVPWYDFWNVKARFANVLNYLKLLIGFTIIEGEFIFAGFLYLAWHTIFTVLVALAFAVGPVFLPMMMFRFTRELAFEGWLGFLWTGLMYLFVGPAILGLISAVLLNGVGLIYSTSNGLTTVDTGTLFALFVLGGVAVYLMLKLPTYVGQLSAGAAHAGSASFGDIASRLSSGSSTS